MLDKKVKKFFFRPFLIVSINVFLFSIFFTPVWAQVDFQNEIQKLTATPAIGGARFGHSLAISGDVAIIGASRSNKAYIFRRNGDTWEQEAILVPTIPQSSMFFGYAVDIDGDVSVVAGPFYSDAAVQEGAAWVFRRVGGTWDNGTFITIPIPVNWSNFGISLAVSGNIVLVGAFKDTVQSLFWAGAVYPFHYNGTTWEHKPVLTAQEPHAFAQFGNSVDLDGTVAVIGAWDDLEHGAAYVFEFDGNHWQEKQKITHIEMGSKNLFGASVAIDGNLMVVGAPWSDDIGPSFGAAYVYHFNGTWWEEETPLYAWESASDRRWFDSFGASVAISGNVVIIGAYDYGQFMGEQGRVGGQGAAYVYHWDGNGWIDDVILLASDGDHGIEDESGINGDRFGASVSISGDVGFVGAYREDAACGNYSKCDSGAVYVFGLTPGNSNPCPTDLNDDGHVSAGDLALLLGAWGTPGCGGISPCASDLNGDGAVSASDLSSLLNVWGFVCP